MVDPLLKRDGLSRRSFLERAAKACLGVSILPLAGTFATAAAPQGTAKHVIYLFMSGGMSHLETFDPKPGNSVQGPTGTISTALPSVQFSEHLPKLAQQAKEFSVIRSMTTETGDHEQGRYLMRTSYPQLATVRHPSLGPWIQHLAGTLNATLPASVAINTGTRHPGAGFLNTRFNPIPIGDPNLGLQNIKTPKYLSDDRFNQRMKLVDGFDQSFREKYAQKDVKAYTEFYQETVKLLSSQELAAFDLAKEDQATRDKYGQNPFGQGCLLARRLVEHKVRFVDVGFDRWDHHDSLFQDLPEMARQLDQAMSALLTDLQSRGLLKETLVALVTEFGRKPTINAKSGRDHHPGAFSTVLAGGGIKSGLIHGASDKNGHAVTSNHATPADLNATIATALGLPLQKETYSPEGRPFTVAASGKPIQALLG